MIDSNAKHGKSSFVDGLKDSLNRMKTIDGYDYKAKERYHEAAPENIDFEEFKKVVESRRSVRKFTDKKVPRDVMDACLDLAMLAPSSCNLQPWEFHVVQTPNKKEQLVEMCMSQHAATTAAELVVIVARTKSWPEVAKLNIDQWPQAKIPKHWKTFYQKGVPISYWQGPFDVAGKTKKLFATIAGFSRPINRGPFSEADMRVWAAKSTALAAENLMLAFRAHGFDSCPMEGMDEKRVKKLLKLPKDASVCMVLGVGERAKDGVFYPRVQFDRNNFINYV